MRKPLAEACAQFVIAAMNEAGFPEPDWFDLPPDDDDPDPDFLLITQPSDAEPGYGDALERAVNLCAESIGWPGVEDKRTSMDERVEGGNMICQECKMTVPNNDDGTAAYHPHLHCVIWKAYRRNPTSVLTDAGYIRVTGDGTIPPAVRAGEAIAEFARVFAGQFQDEENLAAFNRFEERFLRPTHNAQDDA